MNGEINNSNHDQNIRALKEELIILEARYKINPNEQALAQIKIQENLIRDIEKPSL